MATIRSLDLTGMHQERFIKATRAAARQWVSGDSDPNEMHVVMDAAGSPLPVIMVFHAPEEVDMLIRALSRVRDATWPGRRERE